MISQAPTEVRIAFEVALELRMLPKFSDDGAPEGTVERPLSVERVPEIVARADDEDEVEIALTQ